MEGSNICFIEQNLLPFEFRIATSGSYRDSCKAISDMQVRGAGAIGALAGFAMAQAFLEAEVSGESFLPQEAKKAIESTRPTARNLFFATSAVFREGEAGGAAAACKAAQRIADEDSMACMKIGEHGLGLIGEHCRILTHCNAGWLAFVDYGSALAPIYQAHSEGRNVFVYADETRPRLQGARLTAWELGQASIPHAIIPDNAAAWLMAQGKVDLVITGADRIARNGDTANKIGTLEKALAAKAYGIPFYIAAPLSTFDFDSAAGSDIMIEERSPDEVLEAVGPDIHGVTRRIRLASPGSQALNPSFDVTPFHLITGFITEKGIFTPSNLQTIEQT